MSHPRFSSILLSCCLFACARQPSSEAPSSGAGSEASDTLVETSVCEHMWTLKDGENPETRASGTAASPAAASHCVPELVAHRSAIGDEAFEREVMCAMAATTIEALELCPIGPDQEPRELCRIALELIIADSSDMQTPSEVQLTETLDKCTRDAGIERLTSDPGIWKTEVACVRAATTMDALMACDPDKK